MINPQPDILSLIPQKQPFVMIDQLTYSDETTARTTFKITDDNVLADNGRFTEAGLTENIAQTAAAGIACMDHANGDHKSIGYIGAIKNLEIFALPNVGDTIDTEIIIEDAFFGAIMIAGKVMHKGLLVASCKMKLFIKN